MHPPPKDTRSAAQRARDKASLLGSLLHEGYVPTPDAEAVHERVERGELTTEEAIEIFRARAHASEALSRERQQHRSSAAELCPDAGDPPAPKP